MSVKDLGHLKAIAYKNQQTIKIVNFSSHLFLPREHCHGYKQKIMMQMKLAHGPLHAGYTKVTSETMTFQGLLIIRNTGT